MHTSIHSGGTGYIRHSPRNGFNSLYRALPGDRALLPPSSAGLTRDLNASVGAPGPHAFAVRAQHRSSSDTACVHRIPPRVRDDAYAPLAGRDGGKRTQFLIFGKKNICAWRTDNPNQIESLQQISIYARAIWQRKTRCPKQSSEKSNRFCPTGESVCSNCHLAALAHRPVDRGRPQVAGRRPE
jgi:hypothetical protein